MATTAQMDTGERTAAIILVRGLRVVCKELMQSATCHHHRMPRELKKERENIHYRRVMSNPDRNSRSAELVVVPKNPTQSRSPMFPLHDVDSH